MTKIKPFAFVLMPLDDEFNDLYKFGIKKTANELGIIAERVDEQQFSETILERIYRQIENCDFIIADMTGKNPNVFYEVGYAHAKGKLCALITQNASDIPFDLKHHTHIIYNGTIGNLVEKLKPKLSWLMSECEKDNQQQIDVSYNADSGYLKKTEYIHKGSFELEITLRNKSERHSPEIEAYYIVTTRKWALSVDGAVCGCDDYEDDNGKRMRKHLINPSIRRLAPTAFAQIKLRFERDLWRKWSGEEMKEEYFSKGMVTLEVITSKGTLQHDLPLETTFSEFPF